MITAEIRIEENSKLLNACFNALKPEQDFKKERAEYNLIKKEKQLIIKIKAKDIIALRAIMNSITSLLAIVNQNWRVVYNE